MQIVSHKMSKPVFWAKIRKNISKCRLLKFLPRVLSVNIEVQRSLKRTAIISESLCLFELINKYVVSRVDIFMCFSIRLIMANERLRSVFVALIAVSSGNK